MSGIDIKAREDREFFIFAAQCYLRESRSRRHQRPFSFVLLDWAAHARQRAMTAPRLPVQGALFSGKESK